MIKSFLEGRTAFYQLPAKRMERIIQRGCAQGSVLGLPLWNINMNSLLVELRGVGFVPSAYVDDFGVGIEARSRVDLENKAAEVTQILMHWC